MTIIERILEYLDFKGFTKYDFCKKLGVSKSFLDKKREIKTDIYANILGLYPDVSPDWLLTGEGGMLRETQQKKENTNGSKDLAQENVFLKEINALLKQKNSLLEENKELITQENKRLQNEVLNLKNATETMHRKDKIPI